MNFDQYLEKVFPQKNPFLRKDKDLMTNCLKWVAIRLAFILYKLKVTANFINVFGMVVSMIGFVLFIQIRWGNPKLALIGIGLICLHVFFDFVDGSAFGLAKLSPEATQFHSLKIQEYLDKNDKNQNYFGMIKIRCFAISLLCTSCNKV